MNKSSETKNSGGNSSGAANAGNNKIKNLIRIKNTITLIKTLAVINKTPRSAPTVDRMVTS